MNENQIVYMTLDEVIPYASNPRDNSGAIEAVANSIREFGFINPIVIDAQGEIVAGHTRALAARRLGLEKVPVIKADYLTPEQVKAFRLADNNTAELAEWDIDLLEQELADILDIDMSDFGFDEDQNIEPEEEPTDDDFDPEPMDEAVSKYGQVWKLGRHRLMVGDSTKAEDVQKLLGGEQLDLLVTDPPYNVAYQGGTDAKLRIMNDSMDDAAFRQFLTDAFRAVDTVMKEGAPFYIWYASREHVNFELATRATETWTVKQQIIWAKNALVLGRQDYQWRHEPCLYGWKQGAGHYFIEDRTQTTVIDWEQDPEKMKKDELVAFVKDIISQAGETSVMREDKPLRNGEHPTMKPIPLFARLIKNSSRPNENVGDIFGGSGTTIIACEQLNRNAFSMELDPLYADVQIRRWEEFTGEKAELIEE
jgi:site-specific DNA-methyltransferase (adenine-specific)